MSVVSNGAPLLPHSCAEPGVVRIRDLDNPETFQRLVHALYTAQYGADFQVVDDSGGDYGNDGYIRSRRTLLAIYCPEQRPAPTDRIKRKIDDDLSRTRTLIAERGYRIETWIFVTPQDLREPTQQHVRDRAQEMGLTGICVGETHLRDLFLRQRHLHGLFPDLVAPQVQESLSQIQQGIDEIKAMQRGLLASSGRRQAAPRPEPAASALLLFVARAYELTSSNPAEAVRLLDAIRLVVAASLGQGRFANRFAVHYRPDFVRTGGVQLHDADALRTLEEVRAAGWAEPESDDVVRGGLWRLTARGIAAAEAYRRQRPEETDGPTEEGPGAGDLPQRPAGDLSENTIQLIVAASLGQRQFANRFAVHYRPDFVRMGWVQLRDADALRTLGELRNEGLAEPESDDGVRGGLWRLTARGIDAAAYFRRQGYGPPPPSPQDHGSGDPHSTV